jgi:nucleoside-diphosphate-sugar epimerase
MLVVVAGITGHIGQKLLDCLTARGHHVRGLRRNPSKLDEKRRSKLEGFVVSKTYYDVDALERACDGADAVICAYFATPELHLDGQLLLLRAAERAGISRFITSSWNCDWSRDPLGLHESYDPLIAFRRIAGISSTIKPIYIFTEVLAEVLFAVPGHPYFSQSNGGIWDPSVKSMAFWGTGDEPWPWTTEHDAARFSVALLERQDADRGGCWRLSSGVHSMNDIAAAYENVKGRKVQVHRKGTVEALRARALGPREQDSPLNYFNYMGLFYQLYVLDGTWPAGQRDNDLVGVVPTTLEGFLEANSLL